MNSRALLIPALAALSIGCAAAEPAPDLDPVLDAYYAAYEARSDVDGFLEFYADSVELKDYITGDRIVGRDALREFFDWQNPAFRLLEEGTLVVEHRVVEGNRVVASGYFNPFGWGDLEFEAMQFTTILTFDDDGRIARHEDWINYPNDLLQYDTRGNSNLWLDANAGRGEEG